MSEISLIRLDADAKLIKIKDEKTVIGRGPFLQVADKRVSRNHAVLEVINGQLNLTPTHINPCFFKKNQNASPEILKKDVRRVLENGQVIGLLPDSLFFKVNCPTAQNGTRKSKGKSEKEEDEVTGSEEEEEEEVEEEEVQTKAKPGIVRPKGGGDMTLPLKKKRKLPQWLVQLAKSAPHDKPAISYRQTVAKSTKPKSAKADSASPAKKAAGRKLKTESEEDEDFDVDEEESPSKKRKDQPSISGDPEQERFHEYKREESFPDNWNAMEEHVIQKKGYVLVQLEHDTPEYEQAVLQFFQSMVDQNVEVTSVHRVQNPIQWKYYCVKKSEIQQDNDGFALEKQLFHGTSATAVDAICRRGFDWRVCGKHGTLYGQGSYFAGNASYSHQYTDLKPPRHLSSSMMLSNPMSMTLPTTPSLIYPPVNTNFGQPLNSLTFTPPVNINFGQVVPKQPAAIRTLVGHPSSGLMPVEGPQEIHKGSAKVFLARVLVGRYVKGHPKLRKPPPLYPRQDPFGKCFDSCVDEPRNPKIFVIFDSAQAYPEYLLEYSFSTE